MKIGIADTMFARVNMGEIAEKICRENQVESERYTVPGFKDLPLAAKLLVTKYQCDAVVALGWVGGEEIDELCAHEANLALAQAELMVDKHILKVFIHTKEAPEDEEKLKAICIDRAQKHTQNAIALAHSITALTPRAGTGARQGGDDAGALK